MTDSTKEFFDSLTARSPEPLMTHVNSTMRFDLEHGTETDHWLLTIRDGELATSHEMTDADAVIGLEKGLFDRMVLGEANAMSAYLRGLVAIDGDAALLVRFQRLLPGPPAHRTPVGAKRGKA